jgi:hypothetical protein
MTDGNAQLQHKAGPSRGPETVQWKATAMDIEPSRHQSTGDGKLLVHHFLGHDPSIPPVVQTAQSDSSRLYVSSMEQQVVVPSRFA